MMMKDLPNVKIIGTSSQGALSDILTKKLPNGWSLDLSNMRFYDKNMVCYENIGIPVDVEVQNTLTDLKKGIDPVLTKAINSFK